MSVLLSSYLSSRTSGGPGWGSGVWGVWGDRAVPRNNSNVRFEWDFAVFDMGLIVVMCDGS